MRAIKQFLLLLVGCGWLAVSPLAGAQTWTLTSAPLTNWISVATSADGGTVVAGSSGGIWLSTDSGVTWKQTSAVPANWDAVSCSADGTKFVAMGTPWRLYPLGPFYTSTDCGVTWISNTVPQNSGLVWLIASADGSKLMGLDAELILHCSTNSGVDWTTSLLRSAHGAEACSASGGIVLVSGTFGWVSTNWGASWTAANGKQIISLAASADGSEVAGTDGFNIYRSTNLMSSWVLTAAPNTNWITVASSADGSRLVAVTGAENALGHAPGPIYTSSDFGLTWVSNSAPSQIWQGAASSADGRKLYAITASGGIWTSQSVPAPVLEIALTNGLQFSWIVPCTNLILQTESDLGADGWTDVTNAPVCNLSNLKNQVVLPATNGRAFFRLRAR